MLLAALAILSQIAITNPISDKVRGHEDVEWSVAYGYDMVNHGGRPRVLLVGDSITREYYALVRQRLAGKVNVSYWASSYCVTSAGYLKLLEHQLEEARFDVVHFNNGMHSLGTPKDAYGRAFAAAIRLVHEKQPWAKVIWVSTTPCADAAKTAKVRELNEAGSAAAKEAGVVAIDDLFALTDKYDRKTYWTDNYHHQQALREIMADAVAKSVLAQASTKAKQ